MNRTGDPTSSNSYQWDNSGIVFDSNFVENAQKRQERQIEARKVTLAKYHKNKKPKLDNRYNMVQIHGKV